MAGMEARSYDSRDMVPHTDWETTGIITAATFLKDNLSELALSKIKSWRENYHKGKMFIRKACSDARALFDDLFVWTQRSVAAGFPHIADYDNAYAGDLPIVVDTHYGEFELGNRPEGCGGQDASAEIESGTIQREKGITEWAAQNVDKDPIIQGISQASEIMDRLLLNKKPGRVFVTTQNHVTGEIMPVGELAILESEDGKLSINMQIPPELWPFWTAKNEEERKRAYDPSVIYANEIPHLSESRISPELQEYLAITRKKIEELKEQYPNFSERQAVQNKAKFMVISANKVPLQVRYPHLFGELGSAFQVDIPRLKTDRIVHIPEDAIESAVCQIQYAMEHAVKHNGKPEASFSNSKILFVETGSFHQSQKIADRLFQESWAQEWLALGGQVFLAETHGAVTSRVEEYFPLAA